MTARSMGTMPVLLGAVLLLGVSGGIHPGQVTVPGTIPPADFTSQVDVDASADQVWTVLADFAAYPIWNPFIYPLKGELHEGAGLDVTIHPGNQIITYQATVTTVKPGRELAWSGRFASAGVFTTTYGFSIEPLDPGRARLISRETHQGALAFLSWGLLKDVQAGLAAMIRAARTRAELVRFVHH